MLRAIYEDGVFKPIDRVDIPEGTFVAFTAHPIRPPREQASPEQKLAAICAIIAEQQTIAERSEVARKNPTLLS